ncbi:DUF488 domain-containing protein [Cyanobacterium aponinum UTEX 3222]|uniref:DUF488 domain-containing protein n=1 Tax=Cyanobacterium aponinum (strain PCC 10605) TaxID=755178 RepID=K9Z862_CYAAP|nr:DUF488 domain-containing protein [Cyanobacterium aponinum]AFZ54573.1 hypothetical protein Cyan10605_2492 [Cyanobacterium aponinum PCC 10605]WRL37134.1 DUF488 domain-containing protein [Cyanobacterium aponinum UTEX 3221]WRL43481.1 DUF488 domain-containing protein [Cyanobacterium aponinum UTEX 3222]
MKIFTIGHSNHSIEKFIDLLKQHQISAIADVRSTPYSRYNQQYNQEKLKHELRRNNISYSFLGKELGARSDNPNCYEENKVVYDKIAQTEEFLKGLKRLKKGLKQYKIALMCAEKDPINCHRAILISRYLKKNKIDIWHILPNGQLESQTELEQRLIAFFELNLSQQLNLFEQNINFTKSEEELIEEAYTLQGEKIAYLQE